jgi:hypothetical protein
MFDICEVHDSGTAEDPIFHLVGPAEVEVALCGRQVANRTMIPLECWGSEDARWCKVCWQQRYDRRQVFDSVNSTLTARLPSISEEEEPCSPSPPRPLPDSGNC